MNVPMSVSPNFFPWTQQKALIGRDFRTILSARFLATPEMASITMPGL